MENYEEFNLDDLEPLNIDDFKDISKDNICLHTNTTRENDIEMCSECGLEISRTINLDAEWHYYGDNTSDPSRCQLRRNTDDKSIYKDIDKFEFPYDIKEGANKAYIEITNGQIKRAKLRKCLIAACIFKEFQLHKIAKTPDEIIKIFELTKKQFSKGMIQYNLKKKDQTHPTYISPVSFIPGIMKLFNSGEQHVQKVSELYDKVKNRSEVLNRSNPQSVIAGLIFYYFKLIGMNIILVNFSKVVKLSDITILKISKNISEILGTTNKINIS